MQDSWVRFLGQKDPWRRAWQPTPAFLPGESHGQRSLVGYSPQGHKSQIDWATKPPPLECSLKEKYKNSGNTFNIILREMQIITTLKTIFTYQIGKIFLKCEILCLRLGLLPIAGWSWSTPMESNLIIRNDKIRYPWLSISNLRVAVVLQTSFHTCEVV